jgi:hypothetical protein
MAQAVSYHTLTRTPGLMPEPVHVGFVIDKVVMGQASL